MILTGTVTITLLLLSLLSANPEIWAGLGDRKAGGKNVSPSLTAAP